MLYRQLILKELTEKGFKVINGEVYSPNKKIKLQLKGGYPSFSHRMNDNKTRSASVHRLVAYQKFGDVIFEKGIQVRHLDGNPLNNLESNIEIGTASENMMDKLPEIRRNSAIFASKFCKKYPHKEIIKKRKEGYTYAQLMKEFDIKSKGAISFIINKSIDNIEE